MKRGDLVRYVSHPNAAPEFGIVTGVRQSNDHLAFVRFFRTRSNSEATSQENLNVIKNMEEFLTLLE